MTRKIRKACRAGNLAGIGQVRTKPDGQPQNQIPELDSAHQRTAGPAYGRGPGPAENDADLAELVWKYFSEEITQAVIEVQQALAQEPKGSSRHSWPRKG